MNINVKRFCTRAEKAAKLMKAMANAHRLMILCRLREGPCSVGDLESLVGLGQSALSQHLARLRQGGLVKTRRQAQTIIYSLDDPAAAKLVAELYGLYCGPLETTVTKGRRL